MAVPDVRYGGDMVRQGKRRESLPMGLTQHALPDDPLILLAQHASQIAASVSPDGESPWAHLIPDQRRYLAAYAIAGTPTRASQAAGVGVQRHSYWLANDAAYADAFQLASAMAAELLESEARRRALLGYQRPIYQRGVLVGYEQRYSDTLMLALLQANMPAKYGRTSVDHRHSGAVASVHVDVRDLSDADLLALASRGMDAGSISPLPGGLPQLEPGDIPATTVHISDPANDT